MFIIWFVYCTLVELIFPFSEPRSDLSACTSNNEIQVYTTGFKKRRVGYEYSNDNINKAAFNLVLENSPNIAMLEIGFVVK